MGPRHVCTINFFGAMSRFRPSTSRCHGVNLPPVLRLIRATPPVDSECVSESCREFSAGQRELKQVAATFAQMELPLGPRGEDLFARRCEHAPDGNKQSYRLDRMWPSLFFFVRRYPRE
jgi:hypothetical protein